VSVSSSFEKIRAQLSAVGQEVDLATMQFRHRTETAADPGANSVMARILIPATHPRIVRARAARATRWPTRSSPTVSRTLRDPTGPSALPASHSADVTDSSAASLWPSIHDQGRRRR